MITGQIVVFHTRPSEDITQNSPVRTRLIGAASGKMNRNVANRFVKLINVQTQEI